MKPTKRPSIPFRDREVLLVKDLDEETLEAIRNAQPSERSKQLNYLMDDPGTD
jgi:hypothetical protein